MAGHSHDFHARVLEQHLVQVGILPLRVQVAKAQRSMVRVEPVKGEYSIDKVLHGHLGTSKFKSVHKFTGPELVVYIRRHNDHTDGRVVRGRCLYTIRYRNPNKLETISYYRLVAFRKVGLR